MTYLKNDSSSVHNLPLSSFRYNKYEQLLGHDEIEKLRQHFSNVFENVEDYEGKKIVIVDYAQSGSSIFAAQQYLEDFFKSKLNNFQINSLAITTQFHDPDYKNVAFDPDEFDQMDESRAYNLHETAEFYGVSDYRVIQIPENSGLADLLELQYFDNYSEYLSVDKDLWGHELVENSQYKHFEKFLHEKMNKPNSCMSSVNAFR